MTVEGWNGMEPSLAGQRAALYMKSTLSVASVPMKSAADTLAPTVLSYTESIGPLVRT